MAVEPSFLLCHVINIDVFQSLNKRNRWMQNILICIDIDSFSTGKNGSVLEKWWKQSSATNHVLALLNISVLFTARINRMGSQCTSILPVNGVVTLRQRKERTRLFRLTETEIIASEQRRWQITDSGNKENNRNHRLIVQCLGACSQAKYSLMFRPWRRAVSSLEKKFEWNCTGLSVTYFYP